MKQRVYIETTVVSYLTGRPSRDVVIAAHQELTREWWERRSAVFDLVVSELVREEADRGDEQASGRRMAIIEEMPILAAGDEAVSLAEQLLWPGPIPRESRTRDKPGKGTSLFDTERQFAGKQLRPVAN